MLRRLAIALGVLFLLGAVGATFLPSSAAGGNCGNWISPEFTDARVSRLVEGYADLAERGGGLVNQSELAGTAASIVRTKDICDDALGARRTVTLVMLGMAILVPAGIVFVGRGSSRSPAPTFT